MYCIDMAEDLMYVLFKESGIVRVCKMLEKEELKTIDIVTSHFLHPALKRAIELGLVQRTQAKGEGVGHPPLYHRLTRQGIELLKIAKKYGV